MHDSPDMAQQCHAQAVRNSMQEHSTQPPELQCRGTATPGAMRCALACCCELPGRDTVVPCADPVMLSMTA